MALKDLTNTYFPINFLTLVNQLGAYLTAVAAQSAGPMPTFRDTKGSSSKAIIVLNKNGDTASVMFVSLWRTYVVPLNPKITADSNGTFNKKFNNIATWDSYFFTLRSQALYAVNSNANDPLIKAMDAFWEQVLLIKGTWKVVVTKDRR